MKTYPLAIVALIFFGSCQNDGEQEPEPQEQATEEVQEDQSMAMNEEEHQMFIDVHYLGEGEVTAADVAEAHAKDLAVQSKHHVHFKEYWVDEEAGVVYCLSEAPSKDAVIHTHEEAHGLIPKEVMKVVQGEASSINDGSHFYLDVHVMEEGKVDPAAVAEAHEKDLAVEGKHNVHFVNYWVSPDQGKVYCLSQAENKDDVIATHTEAHGLIPQKVIEVVRGE